jgi:hypothetical protein
MGLLFTGVNKEAIVTWSDLWIDSLRWVMKYKAKSFQKQKIVEID